MNSFLWFLKINNGFYCIFLFFLIFTRCGYEQDTDMTNSYLIKSFDRHPEDSCWINKEQRKKTDGKMVAYVSKSKEYGIGYKATVPDIFKNKVFWFHVHAKVQINDINAKAVFAFSIKYKDSLITWQGLQILKENIKVNEWIRFDDSVAVPDNVPPNATIECFLWKTNETGEVLTDDFQVELTRFSATSFFPKNSNDKSKVTFFNSLSPFTLYIKPKDKNPLLIDRFNTITTDTVTRYLYSNNWFAIDISNTRLKNNLISTKVIFNTLNNQTVEIERIALIQNYSGKLKQVITDKGKLITDDFKDEYWLGKTGSVVIENENNDLVFENNKGISSMQLNSLSNQLCLNLDYNLDHPLLHFPILDSNRNKFNDISSFAYHPSTNYEFVYQYKVIPKSRSYPSIGKLPYGFLGAFLFTEHADFTDLRSHKAVYFGTEDISDYTIQNATGGFVKYNIPVTKSVFYHNPENVLNSESPEETVFNTPLCNIKSTKGYLEFLRALKSFGIEICLHTPDNYTTKPYYLDDALSFMKKEFDSKSWIDHGYDNAPQSNQEDIVRFGLKKESPFYLLDKFQSHNIKYVWNCYYEDVPTVLQPNFDLSLMKPYPGLTQAVPEPFYWRHRLSNDLLHWPTHAFTKPEGDKEYFDYFYSTGKLSDLIKNKGIFISHIYSAWVNEKNYFWEFDKNKKCVAKPEFNNFLSRLSDLKNKGLLYLCTVTQLLDYQLLLENITIEATGNNRFVIRNANKTDVRGLTVFVRKNHKIHSKNSEFTVKQTFLPDENGYITDIPSGKQIEFTVEP